MRSTSGYTIYFRPRAPRGRLPAPGGAPARDLPHGSRAETLSSTTGTSHETCPISTSSTAAPWPSLAWSIPPPPSARWHNAPPSTCATISASCAAPRRAIRVAPIHIGHRQVDETFQTLARFRPRTCVRRFRLRRSPGQRRQGSRASHRNRQAIRRHEWLRVLPRRWVVERTFSWFGRNGRLTKD